VGSPSIVGSDGSFAPGPSEPLRTVEKTFIVDVPPASAVLVSAQ
jgi:hypothetical protein